MVTHYIYMICTSRRKKIGCTCNLASRMQEYRRNWRLRRPWPIYRIIEELIDLTDQQAGDREWYWADHYGLPRGVHYTITRRAQHSPGAWLNQPPDRHIVNARKDGLAATRLGVSGFRSFTPRSSTAPSSAMSPAPIAA